MSQAFKIVQILYTNMQSEISIWRSWVRSTWRGVCAHRFENSLTVSKTPVQVSQKFVGNTNDLSKFVFFFFFSPPKYFRTLFENFERVWVNSFQVTGNGERRRCYSGMISYNLYASKKIFFSIFKKKKKSSKNLFPQKQNEEQNSLAFVHRPKHRKFKF